MGDRGGGRRVEELASSKRDTVTPVVVDLSAVEEIERAARDIAESRSVDVLIHVAGVIRIDECAPHRRGSRSALCGQPESGLRAHRQLLPALRGSAVRSSRQLVVRAPARLVQFAVRIHEGGS